MINLILNFLESINWLPETFGPRLAPLLVHRVFSPGAILLQKDQICDYVYFVKRGLVRAYVERGIKEINVWFMMMNDVIISVDSFLHRKPSKEYLEAIEETEVIGISYDNLQMLYNEFREFERIGLILTGKYYAETDNRLKALLGANRMERYQYLREHHPAILQRVPNKYLASYLGMSIATLGRVKRMR